MDVYKYFNSPDVAAYCKTIGHTFSATQMAYLIWQSNHHTLQQKMLAWEELMEILPDENQECFQFPDGCGLHHFLRKYMARLKNFIEMFREDSPSCVYSYEKRYTDAPGCYLDESPLFANYALCLETALAEAARKEKILSFRLRKKEIFHKPVPGQDDPMLYLDLQGEPVDVTVAPYRGERDLLVPPFGFYGVMADIPCPFKKGDIVMGIGLAGDETGPMVVKELPKGREAEDMFASLWELDHRGRLCLNQDFSALSLVYYKGSLTKKERFLYALRNHIQGNLSMEDLLRSYTITLLEFMAEKRVDFYGWAGHTQNLAGLDREVVSIE